MGLIISAFIFMFTMVILGILIDWIIPIDKGEEYYEQQDFNKDK